MRAAVEGKFDAIFMSLRGEYRRRDAFALGPNTRYILEHAPCPAILGFAPKSIATQGSEATIAIAAHAPDPVPVSEGLS